MVTILIVDDEKLALEGIVYSVGASGIPFRWIMEASSAEEALEIIKTSRPDILLTDIQMGEKSGLDLIREAKELHPDLISAIICGYADFSFAQEALALGACGYLLKPAKPDEIKEVLSKAMAAVREIHEQRDMSKANYLFKRTLQERRLQEAINSFIIGGGVESGKVLFDHIGPQSRWHQIMILRMPVGELNQSASGLEKSALLYGIHNILGELLTEEKEARGFAAGSLEHENVLVGILFSENPNRQVAEEHISRQVLKIKRAIENALGLHLSVSLSGLHAQLSPDLHTQAMIAQDLRFSLTEKAKHEVLKFPDYQDNFSTSQPENIQTLRKFLNTNDISNAKSLIKNMLMAFQDKAEIGIRSLYATIVNAVSFACYKNGKSILPTLGSESMSGSVLNIFDTLDEVYENLHSIISNNMGSDVIQQENAGETMTKIRQYIDASFTDSELGTNKLSKEFSISLGYLSASYKKEHGITISKYIISKRIGYAGSLLDTTELSISEIAEASGFNNLSYFMRLFKSLYAVTPTQYRSKSKANH